MKKTKERTEREEATEKSQNIYANEITAAMRHQGSRFVMETSYVQIENLSFGRFAYHGMNPEIEKYWEEERLKKEEAEEVKREKDVQDEEMVEFYSSISNTISKKFATKRSASGDTVPSTSKAEPSNLPQSQEDDKNFIAKGQQYISNMRNQRFNWKKDANHHKRRKMAPR